MSYTFFLTGVTEADWKKSWLCFIFRKFNIFVICSWIAIGGQFFHNLCFWSNCNWSERSVFLHFNYWTISHFNCWRISTFELLKDKNYVIYHFHLVKWDRKGCRNMSGSFSGKDLDENIWLFGEMFGRIKGKINFSE